MPAGFSPERIAQMQQQGFTGSFYDQGGNLVRMNKGQMQAPAGSSAQSPSMSGAMGTPQAQRNPWQTAGSGFDPSRGNNAGPMANWASWMTQGGVNPTGWQGLGGQPNTDFLNASHWTQGGADPTRITPTDPQSGFQPYIDRAYQQATRQLDPQWNSAKTQFEQDMVNRGLAPGSAAYDAAFADFNRAKADAYSSAQNSAQQQGLAAQNQAFGQGLQSSQLSSALAQALIGANSQYAGQQLGGNASVMNSLLGGNQGISQALIGQQASDTASSNAAGASMYNAGLQNQLGRAQLYQSGQQMDFNNLMSMLNLGMGATQYNNSLLPMDQQRQMSMYGGMPNGNYGNIDVMSPYNNQYNGQMNQWNYQNQQANAQNQNYAQWASMLASMYGYG